MSTIADLWKAYLTGEGYTFSSLQGTIKEALLAETGRTEGSPQELWKAYLEGEGYDGAVPDMMKKWLVDKGYDGTVQDMLKKALRDGDIFAADAIACTITLTHDGLDAFGLAPMSVTGQRVSVTGDGVNNYGMADSASGVPISWSGVRIVEYKLHRQDGTPRAHLNYLDGITFAGIQLEWQGGSSDWRLSDMGNNFVPVGSSINDVPAFGVDGATGDVTFYLNGTLVADKSTAGYAALGGLFSGASPSLFFWVNYLTDGDVYDAEIITQADKYTQTYPAGTLDWCGQAIV